MESLLQGDGGEPCRKARLAGRLAHRCCGARIPAYLAHGIHGGKSWSGVKCGGARQGASGQLLRPLHGAARNAAASGRPDGRMRGTEARALRVRGQWCVKAPRSLLGQHTGVQDA